MRKTSIIIVTYNNLNYTKECIDSIKKYTPDGTYEIIIIDNLSTDETRNWLATKTDIKIILNDNNVGFPKACNQGIKIADPDNDILLLNNDTIVTTNWLTNLKKCLYSDDKIGATGTVCNHNENLQGVDFTYDNFDVMQEQAKINNISNSSRWEEKIFLIGYCILIRREVIEKIGYLDEAYSPGYVDDNDLSLKIIEAGYKLMLCHDSFIHHYLGSSFRKDLNKFYPILYKNRDYFYHKWGFETIAFDDIKYASLRLLNEPVDKEINILELQVGIGVNALKIKYNYPKSHIDGIENNYSKYRIASKIFNVYFNDKQIFSHNIKKDYYDYIIIGDFLEKIANPDEFIKDISKYLKLGGYIIGEGHNASYYVNIIKLLNDNWYTNNNRNLYTISDINQLFSNNSFNQIQIFNWYDEINDKKKQKLNQIGELSESNIDSHYNVHYYAFKFQKLDIK